MGPSPSAPSCVPRPPPAATGQAAPSTPEENTAPSPFDSWKRPDQQVLRPGGGLDSREVASRSPVPPPAPPLGNVPLDRACGFSPGRLGRPAAGAKRSLCWCPQRTTWRSHLSATLAQGTGQRGPRMCSSTASATPRSPWEGRTLLTSPPPAFSPTDHPRRSPSTSQDPTAGWSLGLTVGSHQTVASHFRHSVWAVSHSGQACWPPPREWGEGPGIR